MEESAQKFLKKIWLKWTTATLVVLIAVISLVNSYQIGKLEKELAGINSIFEKWNTSLPDKTTVSPPTSVKEIMPLKLVEKLSPPQENKKITVSEKNYNIWITDNEKKTQKQVTFEGQAGDNQYLPILATKPPLSPGEILSPDEKKIIYFVFDGVGVFEGGGNEKSRETSFKRGVYILDLTTNQRDLIEELPDGSISPLEDVFWDENSSVVYYFDVFSRKKKYTLATKSLTELKLDLPAEVIGTTQHSFSRQTGNLAYATFNSEADQSLIGVTNLLENYNKILAKGWSAQYQFPKISPNGQLVVYFEGQEKTVNLYAIYLYDLESEKKTLFGFADMHDTPYFLNDQYFVIDRFGTTPENIKAGPFIIDFQTKQYAKYTSP